MSADPNAHLGTRSTLIGRHSECDLPTINTLVELYHPVFCRFQQGGNDRSVLPPPDVVAETAAFMKSTENNWGQMRPIDHLLKILGIFNGAIADEVYPSPSSVVLYPSTLHKSAPAAIVLEGLKFGSGGSDPTIEAFYVYKKLWAQPEVSRLFFIASLINDELFFLETKVAGILFTDFSRHLDRQVALYPRSRLDNQTHCSTSNGYDLARNLACSGRSHSSWNCTHTPGIKAKYRIIGELLPYIGARSPRERQTHTLLSLRHVIL